MTGNILGNWGAGGIIPVCRLCAAAQCRYSLPRATSQGRRYPRAGRRSFRQHPWGAGPAGAAVSQGNIPGGPAVGRQHPRGPAVYPRAAGIIPACRLCPGQHPRAAGIPGPAVGAAVSQGRQLARRYPRATSQGRRYHPCLPRAAAVLSGNIPGPAVSSLLAQGRRRSFRQHPGGRRYHPCLPFFAHCRTTTIPTRRY